MLSPLTKQGSVLFRFIVITSPIQEEVHLKSYKIIKACLLNINVELPNHLDINTCFWNRIKTSEANGNKVGGKIRVKDDINSTSMLVPYILT